MSIFIGIDTSNYTTSAAIYDDENDKMISCKKLLPVENNQIGLMQSKALFCHTRQLPEVTEAAFSAFFEQSGNAGSSNFSAVCVSSRPRNVDGSYMPVFLAGEAVAKSIAAAQNIACYTTAHQVGHMLAALYSANRLSLINEPFLAFHISGGTTECLYVTPDDEHILNCEIVAKSLDLKAGQAIDRVGVMLGLPFPAGALLDELSQTGTLHTKVKPVLKSGNCCLSGLQNMCEKMHKNGEKDADVARFAIEYVYETVAAMSEFAVAKYGKLPFVYAGGVMSNSIISQRLQQKGGIFAAPEYSSDNAAGVAIAASIFYNRK